MSAITSGGFSLQGHGPRCERRQFIKEEGITDPKLIATLQTKIACSCGNELNVRTKDENNGIVHRFSYPQKYGANGFHPGMDGIVQRVGGIVLGVREPEADVEDLKGTTSLDVQEMVEEKVDEGHNRI